MSLLATLAGYAATLPLLLAALLLVMVQYVTSNRRPFDPMIRFLARSCMTLFGIRVRVRGRHRIPPGRSVLFMANHVSIVDPLLLFAVLPPPVRAVELEDHFRWPVWGTITRGMSNIPISHRNTRAAVASLREAASLLDHGISIAILPEGHRTRDGELSRFMRGPFRVALETGVPIVPIAMRGLFEVKNVHSPRFRPGRVEVVFGEAIAPGDAVRSGARGEADEPDRQLATRVRDAIATLLGTRARPR